MDCFPIEIQYMIFSFLDAHDLVKVTTVCKELYFLSRSDFLWKKLLKNDFQIVDNTATRKIYKEHYLLSKVNELFKLNLPFDELKSL